MSQNLDRAIAVIGIDIGKNSFHIVAWMGAVPLCFVRSGRVVKSKHALSICRRA
jgi:hypothetical protein